jgi:CBS domain-containing protein
MKKNESITHIMESDVTTVTLLNTLSEVRSIFAEIGAHHLPVVEGKKLIGLLSYTDLQRIDSGELYKQDPKQADVLLDNLSSIKETMTTNVTTLTSQATVRDATDLLANNSFHSVPVLENNELAGIVTSTDLLKYYLKAY